MTTPATLELEAALGRLTEQLDQDSRGRTHDGSPDATASWWTRVRQDDLRLVLEALSKADAAGEVERERDALRWYAEQVAACRKITKEGDVARAALDRDGGKLAREALAGEVSGADAEVERIMALSDEDLLQEADASDVAWARAVKIGLRFGKKVAALSASNVADGAGE